MASRLLILLILFILTPESSQYKLNERVSGTNRSRCLKGEARRKVKQWNYHTDNELSYPGQDKENLSLISQLWCDYYECLANLVEHLTTSGHLPSVILMVYTGSVARVSCGLCVAPGEGSELVWTYAQSADNLTFFPTEEKDRVVREVDGNMTIYHVTAEDSGVYRCRIGKSVGGLVILEVADEEPYTVVRPVWSQGPFAPSPAQILNQSLVVFVSWTPWSACSVCGRVGRRRRYGICYVRLLKPQRYSKNQISNAETDKHGLFLDNMTRKIFEEFPNGVPCRSPHLPAEVRRMPAVAERANEIMMAMCKEPCNNEIFEVRSDEGEVLERANNSAGVYCLSQALPKQPPVPVRDIIFADYGEPVTIRCPGSTLQDIPVSWRVGTKHLVARDIDQASGGRVHLNARDHLVFTAVLYGDANLYSCWEGRHLAGTVKLVVWAGARLRWAGHGAPVALLVAATLAWCGANRVLLRKRYVRA